MLELMTREEYRVKNSGHPRFLLEALAIKMARLSDLRSIEDLIARIDRAPAGPARDDAGGTEPRPRGTRAGSKRTMPGGGVDAAPPDPGRPAALPGATATGIPASAAAAEPGTATAFEGPPVPANDVIAPARPQAEPRDQAPVEAILKRVHQERGALGGFLEEASWIEISGDSLEISFNEKHAFFKEKVEGRDSLDYLRRVARETAGRELAVRVTVAAPGAVDSRAPSAAESAEAQKQRLRKAAENAPIVRTLLEAFGGQIVDVDQA
jgi:hypothetical protein